MDGLDKRSVVYFRHLEVDEVAQFGSFHEFSRGFVQTWSYFAGLQAVFQAQESQLLHSHRQGRLAEALHLFSSHWNHVVLICWCLPWLKDSGTVCVCVSYFASDAVTVFVDWLLRSEESESASLYNKSEGSRVTSMLPNVTL